MRKPYPSDLTDDQWAILLLALSPEVDLKGVVATHAKNLAAPASGRIIRPLMMPKTPALTPMPSVRTLTAVSVKPGCLRRRRAL